jgi:5-methyltetrahydrofolate--homocysteine methyltransferase
MNSLLERLQAHVLLCDGAMGSRIQAMNLDVARDFDGRENCTEILTYTRPDLIRQIHGEYLEAGADIIKTNSFGGSPITLAEFGLCEEAFSLNKRAAELAREAIDHYADGRARYVLGGIGPGTKLPSLGHVSYAELEKALTVQCHGLVEGGVDGILLETCQDPLQIKAAVNAAKRAMSTAGWVVPIFVQVTVEATGTLLVGSDIAAAATVVQALDVQGIGLNCGTGPKEMTEHVQWLSANWPGIISVQPNAGLPVLEHGCTHYPLSPEELASCMERFVHENGVQLIGGCCGTTARHIAALDAMLRRGAVPRPAPVKRTVTWIPSVASLYSQVPLRQENSLFAIGERCNANGSKAFRERQAAEDWDGCAALGTAQVNDGAQALDVCTAFVGRDEVADMTEVITRLRGAVDAPLVIDSTELPVLEAALQLYGGKAIVNSINFEDGEGPADARLRLAKKFGAAVIALTIDEHGMAKTADRKAAIAKRLYEFAVKRHGLPASDLLFDPLTFTICTGNEDDRQLGVETLNAIELIRKQMPECQVILGLSNISFGLKPAARHTLNSVFLDHALQRGLTGAILDRSRIRPLHQIPPEEVRAAENLIFNRWEGENDPLQAFIARFGDRQAPASVKPERAARVEDRLRQRIIDGDRAGLESDLEEALASYPPLEIINQFLIDGMRTVGDLFGAGKLQLPFVLQSAETMKAAVAYLEPRMERVEGAHHGTIVLATVKGDVHDIGKNLVDILLTNNGYRVINLGIKQPVANIIAAAREHKADAIGMSGLLVKSTAIMRENLETLTREGIDLPVLLGGAALTRAYVEEDCARAYPNGPVAYAGSAFDGLNLMRKVVAGEFDAHVSALAERRRGRNKPSLSGTPYVTRDASRRPCDSEQARIACHEVATGIPVPQPPFWGPQRLEHVPLESVLPYLNETMLFRFHWGFRRTDQTLEEYRAFEEEEVRPILRKLVERCLNDDILRLTASYGFWPAAGDGDDIVLFGIPGSPTEGREIWRFRLPRQRRPGGLCISDFLRDIRSKERDVIGLQVVTAGQCVADTARSWFESGQYRDYLFLHGLGVEITEALAEYVHAGVRCALGIAAQDDRDVRRVLKHGYRGSRYSFGYPACPDLGAQRRLLELLDAGRCGIRLGDEDQLWPEQSTSAIVIHHPQARYFVV